MAYSPSELPSSRNQTSLTRKVHILAAKFIENYTAYVIELSVSDCSWTIQRRYSEFHDLHEKLVALKKIDRALLPPKRFLWNQSKAFVEKRREDLEKYLQKLLDDSSYLPTPLLHFLEFDIYDIYGVSQALATELFEKAEAILSSSEVCEMTPMQLYAITERLKLAVPTCSVDDSRSDIGHIMDFISRLKSMRIVGSRNRLGSSTRIVDRLLFDLAYFKSLQQLQIDVCSIELIAGLVELKGSLRYLAVHHTVSSIKEVLLPEGERWLSNEAAATAQPSSSRPTHVPTWKYISRADFRYNNLTDIDESIKLLPNLVRLDVSHNKLTQVNNLHHLSEMTHLDLSHNRLLSLEVLHTRLGNITTLSLAGNDLDSLKGLGKLYSLVHLDVSKNSIEHVVEVNHISSLPCIESLNLKENPITSIMDYRTKILSLFQDQYLLMKLDGQATTQKELDKVAVLKAIQKSKDTKVKKLGPGRKGSPRHKKRSGVKQAQIVDPVKKPLLLNVASSTSSSQGSSQLGTTLPDNISVASSDDIEFRNKVEEIRREGGESWLSLLNELQKAPEDRPRAASQVKEGHSPKPGRSPKIKQRNLAEDKRSRQHSRSPSRPEVQHQAPPKSPTMKISPKALLHCVFDELARHKEVGLTSIPELIFNLHIYFQGPVLSTYGPRHIKNNISMPEMTGPSIASYVLENMTPESQMEFVELIRELIEGKVQLPSHIYPKREDASEVCTCVLRILGLELLQQPSTTEEETLAPELKDLSVDDSFCGSQSNLRIDSYVETTIGSSKVSPSIRVSEHITEPMPHKKSTKPAPPRIIPTYDDATLENLTKCNQDQQLQLTEPLQVIANMPSSDLVKYFHESIVEIGPEPEKLTHMMWAGAIAFHKPSVEIISCVMLSDRAVYILSADSSLPQFLSPPADIRSHRRMQSDPSIKDKLRADWDMREQNDTAGFNAGRVLKHPHATCGVLLTVSDDKAKKQVRCQHMLKLTEIVEVDVGLFDQKLRLTALTAADTVSLLTRNFQVTLSFLEWLMLVLPITCVPSPSPDRSQHAVDPYKLHRAFTEDFLHPSKVKFSYPNDETINDLTYLIVDFINNPKVTTENTSILLYMLVYQVHHSPVQTDPVTVREPIGDCGERSHRTLVVTTKHLTLCREDHVSYPLPGFMKSPPDNPQYELLEAHAIGNLRRLVVSDFSSRDLTLVFEVMDVVVDITVDHYSKEESGAMTANMPEVAWTLVLPSYDDRERLRKQLCHTWKEIHGEELSIQVNT